jgi:hypothetical protein
LLHTQALAVFRQAEYAQIKESWMGINTQSNLSANMQIGPTDQGMIRIYIEAEGIEIPMDFAVEEAREIAEEILAAAQTAEDINRK